MHYELSIVNSCIPVAMEEHVGKLSVVEGEEEDETCVTLVLHGEDHTLGNIVMFDV